VRYFFVLLWGYLDDYGRGVDDEMLVASDCFPRDRDITPDTVDAWLELMADSGPLCRYEVDGRRYLHCPNWREHQKPQHPTRSKIPPCPDDEPEDFEEWRKHNPERLTRRSRKAREELRKIPTGLSGASQKPSGSPSTASLDEVGATIIQMPGQMAIDDADEDVSADQTTSGNPHESLMNDSGTAQEGLTPEQGSKGAGSKGGSRGHAGAHTRAREEPPARPRPDGLTTIPHDFAITDAMRRWANRDGYDKLINIDYCTMQFISHYRSTEQRRKNWNEAWQKWIRDDHKRAAERGSRHGGQGHGYDLPERGVY
jgi:hypothetical protein